MSTQIYKNERIALWDKIAKEKRTNLFNSSYHQRLTEVYANLIPPGSKILEIGSGNGDLLATLNPAYGVGIDFSAKTIALA